MGVPVEEAVVMMVTVHLDMCAVKWAAMKLSLVTTLDVTVSVLSALFVSSRRPDKGGKCTTVRRSEECSWRAFRIEELLTWHQ